MPARNSRTKTRASSISSWSTRVTRSGLIAASAARSAARSIQCKSSIIWGLIDQAEAPGCRGVEGAFFLHVLAQLPLRISAAQPDDHAHLRVDRIEGGGIVAQQRRAVPAQPRDLECAG